MSLLLSTPHGEDPLTSTHLHLHHHHHTTPPPPSHHHHHYHHRLHHRRHHFHTIAPLFFLPSPSQPVTSAPTTTTTTTTINRLHLGNLFYFYYSSSSSSSSSHLSRPWKTSSHARISWQSVTENGEQWHRTHVAPFSWIARRKPVLSSSLSFLKSSSKSCLYFTVLSNSRVLTNQL